METIKMILLNPNTLSLILFFLITLLNQLVSTLKSIFMANKAGLWTYLTVAIDAFLYTFLVKTLTEQTWITIFLFVFGRLVGTYIGNWMESKIAIGIYDIELYIPNRELQKVVQDKLLEEGFSSTMNIGTVTDNEVRWYNIIQVQRKDMDRFYSILDKLGINNPTMVIRPAKKVTGKIAEHCLN